MVLGLVLGLAPASASNIDRSAFPGANGKIAFSSERDGNPEIYVMNADGTNQTRLTNNPVIDGDPTWSPDGTKIAFHTNRDGNNEIYVMNADGTGATRCTTHGQSDGSPSWAPDGIRLAFQRSDGAVSSNLIVLSSCGGTETQLTFNSGTAVSFQPTWSPDGTKIAFVRDSSGNQRQVWTIKPDGTGPTRVSPLDNRYVDHPTWSPDGTRIAYGGGHGFGAFGDIYVINSDGTGAVTNLTSGTSSINDVAPDWSPDGTKITFVSSRDGNNEIYVMNADGGSPTRLTNGVAHDLSPSWQWARVTRRRVPSDFNGDSRTDPAIRRFGAGPGGQTVWWAPDASFTVPFPDEFGDIPVPADYDGDGKTDVAFYRPSNGLWFGQKSSNGQLGPWYYLGGQPGDIPIPCDYDGDGHADAAYFRPSAGLWFGLNTAGTLIRLNSNATFGTFGQAGDIPVVADYDGDGACDAAIFRPSQGLWYGLPAANGAPVLNSTTNIGQFGTTGDIAVPADYDGDGRADIAYFRPSNGQWFGLRTNGTIALPSTFFGANGQLPVVGYYDADLKADLATYNPSSGQIVALPSAGGANIVRNFGVVTGDVPVAKRPSNPVDQYPY